MGERIGILELLDKLEEVIETGARVPFTGRTLIDQSEALGVLDRLRAELPEEFSKAQEVLDKREAIILDAKRQAADIIEDARGQVAQLVAESEIAKIAQQERLQLLAEARQASEEIRKGADEYADGLLKSLEDSLKHALNTVSKSRFEIQRQIEESRARVAAASTEEGDERSDEES